MISAPRRAPAQVGFTGNYLGMLPSAYLNPPAMQHLAGARPLGTRVPPQDDQGGPPAPGGPSQQPQPPPDQDQQYGGDQGYTEQRDGPQGSPYEPTNGRKFWGGGPFYDPRGKVQLIEAAAKENGIDPDIAVRVAMSEGLGKFSGDGGKSGGAFQLYTGGGLGN